jgi:proteasome lid subunit RPN8/RPN11
MALQLHPDHLQTIAHQATRQYPNECCGLLLGTIYASNNRITQQIWPTQNSWTIESERDFLDNNQPKLAHSQRDRFAIDPRDMLTAQRHARDRNWVIIGIYHSHPDHPAIPSERDRQQAWPHYSYLILSVQQGQVVDQRSWQLDEHHQFQPEAIEIVPSPIITLPLPNDR